MSVNVREKPDFRVGGGGIVDPDFIPEKVKSELRLHLKASSLTSQQQETLLEFANDMAQMVVDDPLVPGKVQRQQIAAIETNARRLLASLKALSQPALSALHAHTDYLAYGTQPPVVLDEMVRRSIRAPEGSLMSSSWDWVNALASASAYAITQFQIDKTTKPEQLRARGYVSMLARWVFDATGTPPPKDQAAWFSAFVCRLGDHLGLPIGPRLVMSGIKAIR